MREEGVEWVVSPDGPFEIYLSAGEVAGWAVDVVTA